jgi:hypothetical protein
MIVVATLENTLGRTSLAPSIAACKFDLPIRRCSKMFSPITMPSSTTIPTAIKKANMVNMFSVSPV